MSNKLRIVIVDLVAAFFVFLFTYTALSKMMTRWSFELSLSRLPVIAPFSKQFAWIIPLTEIAIAIILFFPSVRRSGLLAATALMSVFTIYIGYMIVFIPHLPCSCGGVLSSVSWKQHLIFNIVGTILGLTGWKLSSRDKDLIAINRISRTPA